MSNPERRARRDRAYTLTDDDIESLIERIEAVKHYVSETLPTEFDRLLRLRDKALIATAWTWFKRGGEVLKVKRKDVSVDETEVTVTFLVSKKKRRLKYCPKCGERNGFRSNYCRKCREDLRDVEIVHEGGPHPVTKRKTLRYRFMKPLLEWLQEFGKMSANEEAYLFPPLRVRFTTGFFDLTQPMTIQNFDRILRRLDLRMTSCLFRYGGAEKYMSLGYTPYEMKEIGDWESSHMPEIYAKRKGITPIMKKWSGDTR